MLNEFVSGQVWLVEQPFAFGGIPLGARMTLARLRDGSLWVHSPLEVDDPTRRAIGALGPVRYIVAPSSLHYLGALPFHRSFPEAKLYGGAGVVRKQKQIPFAAALGDEPPTAWAGEIDQVVLQGHRLLDEVAFFHRDSRTLFLTDLMMSMHHESPLAGRLFGKLVGIFEKPGPPVEVKWTFADKAAARAALERMLEWDFERIVFAHGRPIPENGKAIFRERFAFLLQPDG